MRVLTSRLSSFANSRNLVQRAMHLLQDKAYVNGEWVTAASKKTFEVKNPATGEVVGCVPDMGVEDVQKALEAAKVAYESWHTKTGKERSELMKRWYYLMDQHHEELSKLVCVESGKPICESRGEVTYGNNFVEWFAEEARRIRGEIIPSPSNNKKMLVERQAIGVAALITPWNFPHAMITRKAAAAMASGCTCVIKPAEDSPLTALASAKLAEEAGIPKGVFNVITSDKPNASAVGKLLCTSDLVAGISFTGSTEVGKLLFTQCAAGIKRVGLELGGNAPFMVFSSADLDAAASGALACKFRNCGQTCVSANRFLIQEDIHDEFVEKFAQKIKCLNMGNGIDEKVNVGPLVNKAQFEKVSKMVEDAVAKGAKVILGGKPATAYGELYYEPTLLTHISSDMELYKEEVFGPVATLIKFKTEEEGLAIANGTQRGLAGYFYSQDVSQIFRVYNKLECGMVGVNEGIISAAEAPFGGIKESGLGREGSHHGIEDYTYYKYICIGSLT
ncbi:PREDICTED: glutarate-semialdehyde dehydrogenase DavD [Nicrophorus vespilloides]|uniref:Glutarate-semialdehyde dehydrogenase DavD n=1 Tax=Nicrophorus vespilloides TaxID=110193 RepID=A0ABM1N947_NICVS|nr:PREDICTED: glutarate-semialdehyde dehydrogenase DavD [Nicrophorus vespilloides]